MKKLRYLIVFMICLIASGAYSALAAEYTDGSDVIVLEFPSYANGIVNGYESAVLNNVTYDGRKALKIIPQPDCEGTRSLSVDGYSYSKAGIDLSEYCWVAYEYYYRSSDPMQLRMQADMLTSGGAITKRLVIDSEKNVVANKWDVMLFDFSEAKSCLNPDADTYILKQMHFRPFGANNLSKLSAEDTMYVSRIVFFKEKPVLTYRRAFLDGYEDGTFKPGKAVTRAEACKMVACCIAPETDIKGIHGFDDVGEDDWYAPYVGFLYERGLLDFFGTSFEGDKSISRSELVKILLNSGIVQELDGAFLQGNGDVFPATDSSTVTRTDAAIIINQLRGVLSAEEQIPEDIFILYADVEREDAFFAEIAEASFDHVSYEDNSWVYASQDPVFELVEKIGEEALYDFSKGDAIVAELDILERQRIYEIRNTPNIEIPTKNVVYVSSSGGDDSNDGKNENTPVKTLARANALVKANAGWTVLLCRGDIWREHLTAVQGVTYTAYGYGDKPKIYGSPENGAGQNKWTLVYENRETGALIWKYYREDFLDVGTMVFNDGEGFAMKEIPSCVGADYYVRGQENLPVEERTPFDYTVELDRNLEFFHSANSAVTKNSTIGDYINIGIATGPLYLRCDNGNPGKVFGSIEFNTRPSAVTATHNVTIDNICIMYAGVHGISCGTVKNLKVTNCEIGWIGGSIQGYNANGGTKRTATRLGNGVEVYGSCYGYTIDNCYVYQCYDAGVTHQLSDLTRVNCTMNDVTYSNNVITECVYSIEYFLGTLDGYTRGGDNILFDSNIMRRAGYGFGSFRPDGHNQRHIRSSNRNNPFTNYRIVNNVFDRSVHQLFAAITDRDEWKPAFSGNTYIQGLHNGFYSFAYYGSADMDINAKKRMQTILGDETGKVYYVKNIPYWEYDYVPSNSYPVTDSDRS